MWINGVYKSLMQASTESGHFFTVGILFLDKFFWEISKSVVKKIISLPHSFQTQTGQGFFPLHRSKTVTLQVFSYG